MTENFAKALENKEDELVALNRQRTVLERLRDTDDFAEYLTYLDQSIAAKRQELVYPPKDLGHEKARTFIAGEVRALEFARNFVTDQIKYLDNVIAGVELAIKQLEDMTDE